MDHGCAAHPDAAVDFPAGNCDAESQQRLRPSVDVLVIAVDESAVEVKKDGREFKMVGVGRWWSCSPGSFL